MFSRKIPLNHTPHELECTFQADTHNLFHSKKSFETCGTHT